jgi:acetyl esterase/lipase
MAADTERRKAVRIESHNSLPARRARHAASAGAAIVCLVSVLVAARSAFAFELITPAEAALPAAPIPTFELRGSPTRGPHITVVSPPPGAGLMHSPIELKLRYRAFGGASINPETVVITYLKNPSIDITQRLKPFITAAGIDVKNADVPAGRHQFWIELKDNDGRVSGTEFSFQVAK